MLRNDGKLVCYVIQGHFSRGWGEINVDSFWAMSNPEQLGHPPHDSFSAGGTCWQQTGIHGTYNMEYAFEAMENIAQDPNKSFEEEDLRVVRVEIEQTRTVVELPRREAGFTQY